MPTVTHLADLEGHPHANVFPTSEPKTIRLTLDAGDRVEPHRHPGRDIVLYVLDGTLELHLGDDTYPMEVGDVACFDGDQEISPMATEDASALIVLAPSSEE